MMLEHGSILQFFDWFFPIISGVGGFMMFFIEAEKKYQLKK